MLLRHLKSLMLLNNMDERVKILFILPSLSRAGAEIQTVNLINGLSAVKYEKHLICFERDLAILGLLDQENVSFHYLPRYRKIDFSVIRGISKVIDQNKISLVHCSLQISLLMGWLGVRLSRRKPKLISALHTTINRNYKLELFDWLLYRWLMRSCDRIICVCNNQKDHWVRKFPALKKLMQTIYNGVDVNYFSPVGHTFLAGQLKLDLKLPDDAIVIAHIAAFRPEKGHQILLSAFAKIASSYPNAYLVFAGDGLLRGVAMQQVQDLNLQEQVRFLGAVADVRPLLAMSDLAVIASTAVETFSIAMLEAMSMQVPLVATDIGGTSEAVIPKVTGYLVSPNNVKALQMALSSAIDDSSELIRLGHQARHYVVENFTKDKMIEQTDLVFSELMSV